MNFFIRRNGSGQPKSVANPNQVGTKIFGNMDVEYKNGVFNEFLADFLEIDKSGLKSHNFSWVDSGGESIKTGEQVMQRLANTLDSLVVRCCYDLAEMFKVVADLNSEIFPQIISRRDEPGFPILKWNFTNEALSIKHSSLVRNLIVNVDTIVEYSYLFSFFPLIRFIPDSVQNFEASLMAKSFKSPLDETGFVFKNDAVFKEFQKFYAKYSGWDKKNRKLRNYLIHMTDLHTVVYSEKGKATAAFCCAFDDILPDTNEHKLVTSEEISASHTTLLHFQKDLVAYLKRMCLLH